MGKMKSKSKVKKQPSKQKSSIRTKSRWIKTGVKSKKRSTDKKVKIKKSRHSKAQTMPPSDSNSPSTSTSTPTSDSSVKQDAIASPQDQPEQALEIKTSPENPQPSSQSTPQESNQPMQPSEATNEAANLQEGEVAAVVEPSPEPPHPELPSTVREYILEQKLTMVKFLASSTTCAVYLVLNEEGAPLAAKIIDHSKLPDVIRNEHLPKELKIIRIVQHEYIVRTNAVLTALPNYSIIISEFASEGDLITHVEKHSNEDTNVPQIKKWFRETTTALLYLHERHIAHRDVKLDNILLCEGLVAKLADFGFATFCRDEKTGEAILCANFCGTTEYQAPETLLCEEPYDGLVADCFSLGVVLHVLATRHFPFGCADEYGPEELQTLRDKIQAKQWRKRGIVETDSGVRSLLKQLLTADLEERIKVAQVLHHPWLADQ